MIKENKRLISYSLLALIAYVIYLFVGTDIIEYPIPEQSKEEVFEQMEMATDELGIPPMLSNDVYHTNIIANPSIGRYIESENFTTEQVESLRKELPLYTFDAEALFYSYSLDLHTGQLVSASNILLKENPDDFVQQYFGEEFALKKTEQADGIFLDWEVKKTYTSKTDFVDIIKVVDIYMVDDYITTFNFYGLARGYPVEEGTIWEGIAALLILLFLISLIIIVTIHLIIKLVKKQIEAFWEPLLLTIVAGFGWVFISKALGSSLTGIGLLDPAMMIYLTFGTLLIRWKKDERRMRERLISLQPAVFHGFLMMFIALFLAELFFFFAQFFDTWVSPVTSHNLFIQLDIWWTPVFTLFIGLSAAVMEESIFRNYMIPIFDRVGILFSVMMTSVLWGILHIGYDMFPWYLYVLEFIIFTGPLFYFVYKRYGFAAGMFLHYFYNAWVTTLMLFTINKNVAFVSLLVMLSPFLIFIIRNKTSDYTTLQKKTINNNLNQ